jgi:hypothetical protein
MAQGQWRLMKKGKPVKTVRPYVAAIPATNDAEEILVQEGSEEIDEDALKAWEENNSKALGNIFLRLSLSGTWYF